MNTERDIKQVEITRILEGREQGFVAVMGPCSNQKSRTIIHEGVKLSRSAGNGLVTVHRVPTWKPRTPNPEGPKPWEGLEATNPVSAMSRILWECRKGVSVALEMKDPAMAMRYRNIVTVAWLGSRSLGNLQLDHAMTRADMAMVPLGIKNDLTGDISTAMTRIDDIRRRRKHKVGMPAAVSLIFRGGIAMRTPSDWDDAYKDAFYQTAGHMIVDVAHGGEMAHDPNGDFTKSVAGQINCLDHVVSLAQEGMVPAGIMIEASNVKIPDARFRTDPNMPFNIALDAVRELHGLAMKGVRQ